MLAFCFIETGSHFVALNFLELIMLTRLPVSGELKGEDSF